MSPVKAKRTPEEKERLRIAAWLRRIAPQFWNGQRDCDPDHLAECLERNDLPEDWTNCPGDEP